MTIYPVSDAVSGDRPIMSSYRPRFGPDWRVDPILRFSQRALIRLDVDAVFVGAIDGDELITLALSTLDDAGDVVLYTEEPPSVLLDACRATILTGRVEQGGNDDSGAISIPIQDPSGLAIGILGTSSGSARFWSPDEIEFLETLALACSGEIRMRRLERAARTSIERADALRGRTRVLLQLSEGFAAAQTVRDVARTVMQLSIHALNGSYGNVRLLDPKTRTLRHVDLGDFPDYPTPIYPTITADQDTPSARAVRTRTPTFHETLEQFTATYPEIGAQASTLPMKAFAHLPLLVDQRVLGAISISWPTPRTFDADDRAVIEALARYTAQAVDRALLLAEQRDVAQTLQAALLSELAESRDLTMAARYLPAVASERVGGDWYDAFGGPDGSTTLVVGDVSGHDMQAAAIMGQVRNMLRALGTDVPDAPARLLMRLERTMQRLGFDTLTTALVVDVARQEDGSAVVTMSNAGHLPPLLIEDGLPPRYLHGHDRLLGLERLTTRHDHQFVVAPNSTVLLYTDGLVERRTSDLDERMAALAELADQHRALTVEQLLEHVIEEFDIAREDDTVVLAARLA